ncbi:GlxA family transcriptional regulator [Oceanicella actignis]|uniref:Transcriptional regulator GlxA family, contains an amidase domain and an AraC-type DNA-binding HTH domain n=1 Tax=Oceanicella actignis TaxID=1189325 RepID=A0A1M7SAQ3_9RHOB|nr:GlxA family transcriptional regulator [Oceanicella actignis]TYO91552.1 AraC family transcriptional regulator with amidase-like domain [Oceanicella actignis]SET29097.1 transcriptional regulator, AraC family with amidase-like domain [Oceanicella actignis]SHN55523.1 Transcriptional regulator GlxA family, contains an amidase domain and an AraC-type DNA-binding HTH domain [Oceanicella actignis]
MTEATPGAQPAREFVFVLLEDFTLIAFAAAIEPLRIANMASGRTLYRWRVLSESGEPVRASCGVELRVDGPLQECPREATAIICGGIDVAKRATRPLINWLRREARRGVAMGAVCTGAHVLARAGLLDGRRATIHWENREGFAEEFPEVDLGGHVYVLDGDRMTAAGGASSADMMLRIIAAEHGAELAGEVADQLVYSTPRAEGDPQRLSVPARIGVRHPKLAQVIRMMNENIEEPISAAALAEAAGMSTRQLERLFRRYLDRSPKRYYLELRLEKARRLLLQTDMSVINIALACGFTSPSHFSKCYRSRYNRTPYRERGISGPE